MCDGVVHLNRGPGHNTAMNYIAGQVYHDGRIVFVYYLHVKRVSVVGKAAVVEHECSMLVYHALLGTTNRGTAIGFKFAYTSHATSAGDDVCAVTCATCISKYLVFTLMVYIVTDFTGTCVSLNFYSHCECCDMCYMHIYCIIMLTFYPYCTNICLVCICISNYL